jgi:GDP-L-fucose synthase
MSLGDYYIMGDPCLLVTGATGFLGKNVQKELNKLKRLDKAYVGTDGGKLDLTNPLHVDEIFAKHEPAIVLHMAAVCGGILANKNSPAKFLHDNMQMGLNIFESARRFRVTRVYTLGSVCAYPCNCPVPFKEDDLFNGYPEKTNAPYGYAKRGLLMLGNAYRESYGIGGAHLIPVNLYGIDDHFDLVNSHVIPALINKFTSAVKNGSDTVECWGTGAATREFLYAGDAAKAIALAIEKQLDTPLPINIGTGKEISIKDLAELIGKLTGFKGKIVFTGDVSDGQPKRRLDVTRAKEMLGFEAQTDLETGLKKTIRWYNELVE